MVKRNKHLGILLGVLACTVAAAAWAEAAAATEPEEATECGFCDLLKAPGTTLYENKDSWGVNSFKFMGRLQYQAAYVDGDDVDGDDFGEYFTDFRRVRFGAQMGFLRYFKIKGNANFVTDRRQSEGNLDWGYASMDELIASFDARKAFDVEGLDGFKIHYGRKKILVGHEVHQSSKKIKTVERAGISNRAYPTRMTGGWIELDKGPWSGTFGIFTTDDSRSIAGWKGGEAYTLNLSYQLANEDNLTFDFLYNDANGQDEKNLVSTNQGAPLYDWAFSAAWDGRRGKWGLMANAIVGDNGDVDDSNRDGLFYGLVVLPTYDLTDRLELVGRYAFQFSAEDEGIRTSSRYFRREARTGADVNGGRGDMHHSLYGGLNYYICGDNMKIMTGVEWETLDTPSGDADALTLWLAYRMYF